MNKRFCILFLLLATLLKVSAQKVFISTSFHEPATDGLRFIYSNDGWN